MLPHVYSQVGSAHKLLRADVAAERPFPGVYLSVFRQVALLEEGLVALRALVTPDFLVPLLVPGQLHLEDESGVALVAREGRAPIMGAQVP